MIRHMHDQRLRTLEPCRACAWIAFGLVLVAGFLLGRWL